MSLTLRTVALATATFTVMLVPGPVWAQTDKTDRAELWERHLNAAFEAQALGSTAQVERELRSALREAESFGSEDVRLVMTLNTLASMHRVRSEFDAGPGGKRDQAEAERLYKRALAIVDRWFGSQPLAVGTTLHGLGSLYLQRGKFIDAEQHLKRAVEVDQRSLDPRDPRRARALMALGDVYFRLGQFVRAEPQYRRALEVLEQALGAEHRDIAEAVNGLAILSMALGRPELADRLYQRSQRILEKSLGADHVEVAEVLVSRAQQLMTLGELEESERLYRRALVIQEKSLGPDHCTVLRSLDGLFMVLQAENREREATGLLDRAKPIRARCNPQATQG